MITTAKFALGCVRRPPLLGPWLQLWHVASTSAVGNSDAKVREHSSNPHMQLVLDLKAVMFSRDVYLAATSASRLIVAQANPKGHFTARPGANVSTSCFKTHTCQPARPAAAM